MTISGDTASVTFTTQQAGDYTIVYNVLDGSIVPQASVDIIG